MNRRKFATTVMKLLEGRSLQAEEFSVRSMKASSAGYWTRLNPALRITDRLNREGIQQSAIAPSSRRELIRRFEEDGYFRIDSLMNPALIRRMRRGVERVKNAGWPPVFALIYDEFWQVPRAPSLVKVLQTILGKKYRQIPHVWCHHLGIAAGAAGWGPHVDGTSTSKRLSLWFPLTDATTENGCMYVIPRDRMPDDVASRLRHNKDLTSTQVRQLLQSSCALPARAGSVLGWTFGVWHWGSTVGHTAEPRISFAIELLGEGVPPEPSELPLLDGRQSIPSFKKRLSFIATAILAYQKFEPRLIEYAALAERMVAQIHE